MKEIFIFIFSFLLFLSFSYALELEASNIAQGDTVILDDGEDIIKPSSNSIYVSKDINNYISKTIYGQDNTNLVVTCKNGYLSTVGGLSRSFGRLNSETIDLSDYLVSSLTLSIDKENSIEEYAILKCKPIAQPAEILVENSDIDYESISTKDGFSSFVLSKNPDGNITENSIENKLIPSKDINNQPTFLDVLYLQLKTIGNLSDSVINTNSSFNFKNMFKDENKFQQYKVWLEKFDKYNSKEEFEDAFSGTVSLKDVGIAQDIIKGFYTCLNDKNCNKQIDFEDPNDKFAVYKLKDIENNLYGSFGFIDAPLDISPSDSSIGGENDKNILDESIKYYDNLKNICDNLDVIEDEFVKIQTEDLCNKLKQTELNNVVDQENFELGYILGKRIKNLKQIKEYIPIEGLNLKGIYNIYWELNSLNLGTNKLTLVDKIKSSSDIQKQYIYLKNIVKLDKEETLNQKVVNEDLVKKQELLENSLDTYDSFLPIYRVRIFNYFSFSLISNSNGNLILESNGFILSSSIFNLIGQNSFDNINNLALGIGSYISSGIDIETENGYTGIVISRNDNSYLRYKEFSLGKTFKIELGIKGGDLKRSDNTYYLLKQPFAKQFYLGLYNGNLALGYMNGGYNNVVTILDNELIGLDSNKFYKLIVTVDKEKWGLEIKDYDDKLILSEVNDGSVFDTGISRLSLGGNFLCTDRMNEGDTNNTIDNRNSNYCSSNDFDNGGGQNLNKWDSFIDYVKIYKVEE